MPTKSSLLTGDVAPISARDDTDTTPSAAAPTAPPPTTTAADVPAERPLCPDPSMPLGPLCLLRYAPSGRHSLVDPAWCPYWLSLSESTQAEAVAGYSAFPPSAPRTARAGGPDAPSAPRQHVTYAPSHPAPCRSDAELAALEASMRRAAREPPAGGSAQELGGGGLIGTPAYLWTPQGAPLGAEARADLRSV